MNRAEEFVNSKTSELNGLAPDKLTVIKWLIEFAEDEVKAITVTPCCTELKGKEVLTFKEWLNLNNYAKSSEAKYLDENANWFTEKQLLKMYNDVF